MEDGNNAVTTSATPATQPSAAPVEAETTAPASAPVEQTPEATSESSPEKAKITPDESSEAPSQEASEEKPKEEGEQSVPYSRFKEVNDRLKQAERAEAALKALRENPELAKDLLPLSETQSVDPQVKAADEQLRQMGYVKQGDVQQVVEQTIAARDFADKVMELEKTHDGSDGKPKFVVDDVLGYMEQYGLTDPETAYEVKFKDQLADIRARERSSTPATEKPGQPTQAATTDNRDALLEEAKKTGDYTKYIQTLPAFQKMTEE